MTIEKSMDQDERGFRIAAGGTRYSVIDLPVSEEELNKFIEHIAPNGQEYEVLRVDCPYENQTVVQLDLPFLNRLAALWVENDYSKKYAIQMNVAFYEGHRDTPEEMDAAAKEITLLEIGSNEVDDMGEYMASRMLKREFARSDKVLRDYFNYEQYGMGLIANSQIRLVAPGVWHLRY